MAAHAVPLSSWSRTLTPHDAARTTEPMVAATSRPVAALLGALALGSCTLRDPPPDELTVKIQRYYAAHAIEEDGDCPTPEIGGVMRRKVLESAGARTVLRVRYSYFDPSREGATDWLRIFDAERPCTGSAERDFTLERTRLGYVVVAMSGPTRAG